jgi:hypothetical protein
MDGSANGTAAGHDSASGQFLPQNSEYRAKRLRLAERLAKLRLDYDPNPSQEMLLVVIASALDDAERARSAVVRTRAANTARRLLRDIPRKSGPRSPADHAAQALELLLNKPDGV